jgi:tetraacyldisaccharide 4'-kinase
MLTLFGWIYGKIADIRNGLYDRGLFASHSLGARTISIGNITVGGTGKTPLVALVAEILAERGEKVAILSRGYGRENARQRVLVSDGETVLVDAKTGGDEPVELAIKLLGKAVVIADADRVSAAKWAKENYGITAFVLDDGFQHRKAKRDLDIVCIDATNPFGNGKVLPAGTLRESLSNLKRADAIVITRVNLVESTAKLVDKLRTWNDIAKIFTAASKVSEILKLSDFLKGNKTDNNELAAAAYLFCAVGNPESLIRQLRREKIDLKGFRKFPDHHSYTQNDLQMLEAEAEQHDARVFVTTAKDAVKLAELDIKTPCFVVLSDLEIDDHAGFHELVTASSSPAAPSYRPSKTP